MTLKELCKEKGFTLSEVSEKAEISIVYLSNLNTGLKKNPSFKILDKISKILNVSLDELKKSLIN